MARPRCAGCDRPISLATGRENVWLLEGSPSMGLTLELADGAERTVCFSCIDRLPTDPTAADVDALGRPRE